MIRIFGEEIKVNHFPDGSQMLLNFEQIDRIVGYARENETMYPISIHWNYENDEELVTLFYLVKHIHQCVKDCALDLHMSYIPNARLDRVKKNSEVFTLKYFADFINSLNFRYVYVFDPHSDVSAALINNINIMSPENAIDKAFDGICRDLFGCAWNIKDKYENIVLYYPDYGAKKRYSNLKKFEKFKLVYGCKTRDWETGKITGLKICDKDGIVIDYSEDKEILKDKVVLMIDDIVSYGGTLAYSADALKEYGTKDIYAYASHTENSILDKEKSTLLKRLEDGTVKRLFTTNSIYRGENEHIEVNNIF